jgi:DeoR family transcriptional regulator, copper-sensing transcriptional repressor
MKGQLRRREILKLLKEQGEISIAEIVRRFSVSKMTAHRDLDQLERQKSLKRIFGGAVSFGGEGGVGYSAHDTHGGDGRQQGHTCMVCSRPVVQHLAYSLSVAGGEQRYACCAHCGVSAHLMLKDNVQMAMTVDFLSGRYHPSHRSHFVLGSMVAPCCLPSMLTFEDEAMAKRFQSAFGGEIGNLASAIEYLETEMRINDGGSCPHCAKAKK